MARALLSSGLQRRLLLMLLLPLAVLALLNTWFDYRSADNAALQQDRQLLRLVPLLADSIVAKGKTGSDPPVMLTAPAVQEFLRERAGVSAFGIVGLDGTLLLGDPWLSAAAPTTKEPAFTSEEEGGVTYRIVSQRVQTAAGELVVRLADGSDPRQHWVRQVLIKVLAPNLVLAVAAFFTVNWAVRLALRPLLDLKEAVERRSPRDLSAIDVAASPEEVRPLVESLNRLFHLVNAQAESQRRFIADAAHQLRTPLAGLQAQVEAWAQIVIARSASGPSKSADALAEAPATVISVGAAQVYKLRDATRRTSQLANQLLALSRADARSIDAQPLQRVDLKDLCETMLEAHLDAASAKGIDLGLDTQPVHVFGHEWLLRELLGNLVDNAIKYTPAQGSVTLRCGQMPLGEHEPRARAAFLEVEDDGPGVPASERERILERFYRASGTVGEGNGLGLAIADEIARVHHAQLRVAAGANGRGLRVSLLFPRADSA
jgi:two-component system sensor histidine kinase TctE